MSSNPNQQTQGTQSPTHEPATNPLGSSSVSGETSKGLSGQEQRGEGQQGKKQEGGVSAEAIATAQKSASAVEDEGSDRHRS